MHKRNRITHVAKHPYRNAPMLSISAFSVVYFSKGVAKLVCGATFLIERIRLRWYDSGDFLRIS